MNIEVNMDLLDKLESKITLALETVELLNMENDDLKLEVEQLKSKVESLDAQKQDWENKVNNMLGQFETEVTELQQQQAANY